MCVVDHTPECMFIKGCMFIMIKLIIENKEDDYRLYGIPYPEKQQLKNRGYEMDASAVLMSLPIGSQVELYDVPTGETAIYEKTQEITSKGTRTKWKLVSGYIDYIGGGSIGGSSYESMIRLPNGIVAKILK